MEPYQGQFNLIDLSHSHRSICALMQSNLCSMTIHDASAAAVLSFSTSLEDAEYI